MAARKTGIKASSAEYITFVDGDDFIDDTFYEKLMYHVIKDKSDVVCASMSRYISENNIEVLIQKVSSGVYTSDSVNFIYENMNCYENDIANPGIFASVVIKIFKKSMLMKYCMGVPNNIKLGEDASITYPYLLNSKSIVVDNSIIGYYYRVRAGQMTEKNLYNKSTIYNIISLYNYLKPYYESTKNEKIIEQLEVYKLHFIINIFDTYLDNYINPIKIHNSIKELKKFTKNNDFFFFFIDKIDSYKLPSDFKNKLYYVATKNWKGLEFLCLKKSVLYCLHIMGKK